jgi:hypothetical protein
MRQAERDGAQFPRVHTFPSAQGAAQAPQLAMSIAKSTQVPAQRVCVAPHPLALPGSVQSKSTDALSFVHPVPPPGTLAVTVTVTGPASVQMKLGVADLGSLNVPVPVPPVAAQESVTSAPSPALSTPAAERWTAPPTSTADGSADSEETAAQSAATTPWTDTEPFVPASALPPLQTSGTVTSVVVFATTPKPFEPLQPRPVKDVAVRRIV